jgi:hypothetical protein
MAGPIPRATMASDHGKVVHLVSHLAHDGWRPHTLCTVPVDHQRDPIPRGAAVRQLRADIPADRRGCRPADRRPADRLTSMTSERRYER